MSDDQGCLALCCAGICEVVVTTCQQMAFFARCGRGQDTGPQRGGCCDACLAKGFNEDDFAAQQEKAAQDKAAARAANGPPTPQPPMSAEAIPPSAPL